MRLRSPVLAKMPMTRTGAGESVRRVSLRLLIAGPILTAIVLAVVVVAFQLLPERGVGALLYGIHDSIYLPIKGNLFTRSFPTSIVWWSIFATALLLFTVSQLSDRSLIKEPHIRLLGRAVQRTALHRYLIAGSRALHRLGLTPRLMQRVAQRQWEKTLIELYRAPLADGLTGRREERREQREQRPTKEVVACCRRLVALTALRLQLEAEFAADAQTHLRQLEMWVVAALYSYAHGMERKPRYSAMEDDLARLFAALPVERFDVEPDGGLGAEQLFEPSVLYQELVALRRVTSGDEQLERRRALIQRIEDRRRYVLDATIVRLERTISMPLVVGSHGMYQPLLMSQPLEATPIAGRIALWIAVYTALVAGDSSVGLRYAESLEALDWVVQATSMTGEAVDKLRALMEEWIDPVEETRRFVPLAEGYRLLGKLADYEIGLQKERWDPIVNQAESPVTQEAMRMAWSTRDPLQQAAGPAE